MTPTIPVAELFEAITGRKPTEAELAEEGLYLRLLGTVAAQARLVPEMTRLMGLPVDPVVTEFPNECAHVTVDHPLMKVVLNLGAEMLAGVAAENYLSVVLFHPQVEGLSVTFQKAGKLTPAERAADLAAEVEALKGKLEALHFPPDKGRCSCCGRGLDEAPKNDAPSWMCWTCRDRARLAKRVQQQHEGMRAGFHNLAQLYRLHEQSEGDSYVLRFAGRAATTVLWYDGKNEGPAWSLAEAEVYDSMEEAKAAAKAYKKEQGHLEPCRLDVALQLATPVVGLEALWGLTHPEEEKT